MTISCTVYRRRYNGRPAKRWTIEIRVDGKRSQVLGYTDRQATQALAARMVREHERKEVGNVDPFRGPRSAPLAEHVEAFLVAMSQGSLGSRRRGGRPAPAWVTRSRKRLEAMIVDLKAATTEDLQQGAAERLLQQRQRDGWSAKTRDDHAALLRQFGAWLVDDQRIAQNPFARLRAVRDDSSRTFLRHALTVDELGLLIEAAEVRGVQNYAAVNPRASAEHVAEITRQGRERGVLYTVAAYTGLRRGEILALRWSDLVLTAAPAIAVRAETTKNRRAARLELPVWLGTQLAELRAARAVEIGAPPPPAAPVFLTSYSHVTERLKLDAVFAGIAAWDADRRRVVTVDGLVVDFHALRGTLATLAAEAGMPTRLLQEQMRHSDPRLTMKVYAKARNAALRAEVERLPRPTPAPAPVGFMPDSADIGRERPTRPHARRNGT